jgi:preprotein translocase subunit SecY
VSGSSLIRQDIVPMAAGYLLVMAALAIGLRRHRRPRWTRLIRHALSTVIAGYLLLGAVVIIARVAGQFLHSAFTGTALLLAVALPAFATVSGLTEWRRRRRSR